VSGEYCAESAAAFSVCLPSYRENPWRTKKNLLSQTDR